MESPDCSNLLPRHKPANPYNYDELTLAKRQLEINAAKLAFPHIPEHIVAMSWDTVHNIGETEMNDIIQSKRWENAEQRPRPAPGVYNTITIEDPLDPLKNRYTGIKGLDPEV